MAARRTAKPAAEDVLLWMEMGRLYYFTEKHDQAARSFAKVIKALAQPAIYGLDDKLKKGLLGGLGRAGHHPQDGRAGWSWNMIGESFLLAGRFPEAAAAFEKANQALANKGLLRYQLARIDARTGKPQQALEELQVYFDERLSGVRLAESSRALTGAWLLATSRSPMGAVLAACFGRVTLSDPMLLALGLAEPRKGPRPMTSWPRSLGPCTARES